MNRVCAKHRGWILPKSSPEQQRIADLEHALEVAMYWLLRAHEGFFDHTTMGQRQTVNTTAAILANHGFDPRSPQAKALLKRPMEAYHHELEKAVKRVVGK